MSAFAVISPRIAPKLTNAGRQQSFRSRGDLSMMKTSSRKYVRVVTDIDDTVKVRIYFHGKEDDAFQVYKISHLLCFYITIPYYMLSELWWCEVVRRSTRWN